MATERQEAQAQFIAEGQISEARSPLQSWTLPCGHLDGETLVRDVVVREFRGYEEDILASEKLNPQEKIDMITLNCLQRLGACQDKQLLAPILEGLPVGDRVFLLFCARRTTLGDKYPYMNKCPSCKKEDLYSVHLSECKVREMPEPLVRIFDTKLPSGVDTRWHVMTGRDEKRVAGLSRRDDSVTISILGRVELLAGKPPSIQALKELGMHDRNFLRDAFQEHEGGVDLEVSFECAKCGFSWESDLDITQRGFFFPLAAQRRWRQKSGS